MIKTDHGVTYEPYIGTNGQIGFKATRDDGAISFIYLNPSDHDSEDQPNVFVYQGITGDPGEDYPECHINIDFHLLTK